MTHFCIKPLQYSKNQILGNDQKIYTRNGPSEYYDGYRCFSETKFDTQIKDSGKSAGAREQLNPSAYLKVHFWFYIVIIMLILSFIIFLIKTFHRGFVTWK